MSQLPPPTSPDQGKRKNEEMSGTVSKRMKMAGPFAMDDDDDDDDFNDQNNILYAKLQHNPSDTTHAPAADPPLLPADDQPISESVRVESIRKPTSTESYAKPQADASIPIRGCSGSVRHVQKRVKQCPLTYERMIADRSVTEPGKATKSYYGIDIHKLLDEAKAEAPPMSSVQQSIEAPAHPTRSSKLVNQMWTEKYRATKFRDLIGDDRTHRSVLRWLKGWDPIVFPGLAKAMQKKNKTKDVEGEERAHRKILLLTGPPGLGKTTLAHVCAKQAGYEVLEINASDERSRNVVKGRIKDAVGTENVKGVSMQHGGKTVRKPGKPVCVVVDEVDGVVGGSGGTGGEGGFMKALIDLIQIDQRNSAKKSNPTSGNATRNKKNKDNFRLLRPVILICNDVYHPSLRPLRTSSLAEIIHVRRVPLEQVVLRVKSIFEREGIQCDGDGARKLCEISWGLSASRDRGNTKGANDGDIRGVLVEAEWIAHKLRSGGSSSSARLTKRWLEQHVIRTSSEGNLSRGLGRAGTKEIVERVFLDGAGFPYDRRSAGTFKDPFSKDTSKVPVGVADLRKRAGISRLREMVDACGEYDRCVTDCFLTYPTRTYQDDTKLSKPNTAYDWLCFHDMISSKVFSNQDWELNPYMSQATIAFHHLFASAEGSGDSERYGNEEDDEEEHPFSGPRADFAAFEAGKQNHSMLVEFQSSLSAPLLRTFRSKESVATELIPNLTLMLAPDIKPTVVGVRGDQGGIASVRKEGERALVRSAVRVMQGLDVKFERTRVETEIGSHAGWIYRMEPYVLSDHLI